MQFWCPLALYPTLYHGLAIYTEVTIVNVTLVEAVPSGRGLSERARRTSSPLRPSQSCCRWEQFGAAVNLCGKQTGLCKAHCEKKTQCQQFAPPLASCPRQGHQEEHALSVYHRMFRWAVSQKISIRRFGNSQAMYGIPKGLARILRNKYYCFKNENFGGGKGFMAPRNLTPSAKNWPVAVNGGGAVVVGLWLCWLAPVVGLWPWRRSSYL